MTATKCTPIILIALVLLAGWALLQTQNHAVERHGAELVEAARNDVGCGNNPTVTMVSKLETKLDYRFKICFLENNTKIALQVVCRSAGMCDEREITTIPAHHISKPINYVKSIIKRDLLEVLEWTGSLPDWFLSLWTVTP